MAIKISELNEEDIYYRSYVSGPTGKCKFKGTFTIENTTGVAKEIFVFKFIDSGEVVRTNKHVLEKTMIYHRVKRLKEQETSNKLKSW